MLIASFLCRDMHHHTHFYQRHCLRLIYRTSDAQLAISQSILGLSLAWPDHEKLSGAIQVSLNKVQDYLNSCSWYRVKSCYQLLKVSNIQSHTCSCSQISCSPKDAGQSFAKDENFADGQLILKTLKLHPLKICMYTIVAIRYISLKLHVIGSQYTPEQ